LEEALTKAKEKFEATNDELVQVTGYALEAIKYPSVAPVNVTDPKKFEKAQDHPKHEVTPGTKVSDGPKT